MKKKAIKIIIALILYAISMVIKFENEWINNGIFIISYIIVGFEIVKKAIQKKFLNLDEAYVERLVEEMYPELFEKQDKE